MHRSNNHTPSLLDASTKEVTQEILEKSFRVGPRFKAAVAILGVLLALGVVGFIIRATQGFDDRSMWGYQAALFGFLLATAGSAPLVSVSQRLLRSHWRRPLARASELWGVVGLLSLVVMLPLLAALPGIEGRRTIWIEGRIGAPHWWDFVAVLGLVVCGLGLLYVTSLPDLAVVHERATGWRRTLLSPLVRHWRGTERQWVRLKALIWFMGAFYFVMLIGVHTIISMDFSMSLLPGWIDSIYPTAHALIGLQSAVALTMVSMFLLRTLGGYQRYITLTQFWSLAKIMLALSLLWFYFWFSNLITFWYGRLPNEHAVLKFLVAESYKPVFITAFMLNFVVPFGLLMWNPVRKSILGPTIAACSILAGTFFNMIRLYVGPWSIEDVKRHSLEVANVPPAQLPGAPDVLILIGGVAGAVLLYLLASRVIPPVSLWEIKEGMRFSKVRTLVKERFLSVGKPE